jgi:hypothetical protein
MRYKKCYRKAFGLNEAGLIDFPAKISNVRIERIEWGNLMGCSWCFPHGWETINSTIGKQQRNWKKYRKKRWK